MKQYLWKGTIAGKYIPKISWKQATLRKEEGGLGIKDITRNIACMAKHVMRPALVGQLLTCFGVWPGHLMDW
ncbi:hypothetical protein LIER_31277 [Lithospermum erythrorhizon]|uniref:Uncharacterized protein n=1 Tax=Lithospermum erythrorhizon TaxID=34254 RepID=A0AAV3RSB0_LITER